MDKGTDGWSQRTAFVGFDWASDHLFHIGDDGKVEVGQVNISMETP